MIWFMIDLYLYYCIKYYSKKLLFFRIFLTNVYNKKWNILNIAKLYEKTFDTKNKERINIKYCKRDKIFFKLILNTLLFFYRKWKDAFIGTLKNVQFYLKMIFKIPFNIYYTHYISCINWFNIWFCTMNFFLYLPNNILYLLISSNSSRHILYL